MKMKKGLTKEEKITNICDRLLDMFRTGEMPKAVAKTMIRKTGQEIPSDKWSLGNKIIMYAHETEDARGIKQWEAVGRSLKRDTKAIYILRPIKKKVQADDEESGEKKEIMIPVAFQPIPVYRYEDTVGKEIERPNYSPENLPPLHDIAKALGIDIKYIPFNGRAWGSFNFGKNQIKLSTHDVDTFFHELGHAVHNTFKPLKGGQDRDQEIVAEMTSAALCEMYGFEGYIYDSFKYIKHYSKDKTNNGVVKSIMQVLGDVEKVLEIILNMSNSENKIAI